MIYFSISHPREQHPTGLAAFHEYRFDDGTVWTEFYRVEDGYLLRFPALSDFEVSMNGRTVIAHPAIATDETTVEHLYVNQVTPLALSRQGFPSFHASVVTVTGGCVAFLGKTGMGKSTLAASFALRGAAFLTDDSLVIDESDGMRAMPSHASVRLWEDSLEALVGSREQARSYGSHVSYSSKARILADDILAYADTPLPLLAAYRLECEEPDKVTIGSLQGASRQMAWVENSFLLDIRDKDLLAQHFEWTHRIASKVPTFALDYPRDYGMLAEVRQAILQHVARLDD